MSSVIAGVAAAILAILAALYCIPSKFKSRTNESAAPPEDLSTIVKQGDVQRTFEAELDAIAEALKSKDPAKELAERGNERDRT